MAGIQRKLTPHNIKLNVQAVHYYLSAGKRIKKIFDDFSPDLVIETGGYVTGTVLKTAIKCGIKTALHESNSLPGVSVKMLAPKADLVMQKMRGNGKSAEKQYSDRGKVCGKEKARSSRLSDYTFSGRKPGRFTA